MNPRWAIAAILTSGLVWAQEATLEIRQVDADAFPTIKLFVSVVDGQGHPLTDIESGSLRVDESGAEPTVLSVPEGSEPVISFLVIDRSGSMTEGAKMSQAKEAATRFIEMMRPGDKTGIIAFDSTVETLTDPIESKDALKAYVRGIRAEGETACFSAVKQALEALSGHKGRRSVIVLTDGMDNQSEARGDSLSRVSDRAVELGVPVFAIGLGENALSDVLGRLAQLSHGKYAFAPSAQELVGLFQRQAEQIQKEFVLTYSSPNPNPDGRRREVRVRAKWRGKQIEGRNAYAPSGIVPVTRRDEGGRGWSPWGPFLTLAIVLGLLGVVPLLLKRARERSEQAPAAAGAEPSKGRVRVIAPTQAPPPPPPPGRVKILSGDRPAAPAPDAPPASDPPGKPAARVRILPADESSQAPPPAPAEGEPPPPAP